MPRIWIFIVMLSVVMLNAIMLSVVAPLEAAHFEGYGSWRKWLMKNRIPFQKNLHLKKANLTKARSLDLTKLDLT